MKSQVSMKKKFLRYFKEVIGGQNHDPQDFVSMTTWNPIMKLFTVVSDFVEQ